MFFDYSVGSAPSTLAAVSLAVAIGVALFAAAYRNPQPRAAIWGGAFFLGIGAQAVLSHLVRSEGSAYRPAADIATSLVVLTLFATLAAHRGRRPPVWLFLGGAAGLLGFVMLARTSVTTAQFSAIATMLALIPVTSALVVLAQCWRSEGRLGYLMSAAAALLWAMALAGRAVDPGPAMDTVILVGRPATLLLFGLGFVFVHNAQLVDSLRREIASRRRSEERLSDIAETVSDWIWETDADGRITYMSQRVAEVTGRDLSAYVGKTRAEQEGIVAGEELDAYERAMAARKPYRDLVLRTVSPLTGRLHTYTLSGQPAFDPAGTFLGFRGTGRDVSDQLESRAVVEAILGVVGNAVGVDYTRALVAQLAQTLDGDVVFVGAVDATQTRMEVIAIHAAEGLEAFCAPSYALAGTPSAVVAAGGVCVHTRGVADIYPEDSWLRSLPAEGYVGVPLRNAQGATTGILALVRRRPIANGDVIAAVLRAHAARAAAELDRQIADRALRESEARFRSVIDNMPIAVGISDRDGRLLVVNRTLADWLAMPVSEVVGRSYFDLGDAFGVRADEFKWIAGERDAVLASGEPRQRESRRRYGDGKVRDATLWMFPVRNFAGETVALGSARMDITAVKQMERELAESQKVEALGRFAGGIAHDFNNIVGAIAGFASFLREDAAPGSHSQRHAERIVEATGRAKDLIQQILSFSRSSGPQLELADLPTLMNDTLGFVTTIAAGPAIETQESWPPLAVEVDQTQFMQLMMNLCSNARHAMRDRPGSIAISAAAVVPSGGSEPGGRPAHRQGMEVYADGSARLTSGMIEPGREYVVVQVADRGCGMSRDVLARVLDPFFTTKGGGEGTGLGVPVVHRIMLGHGGAVSIHSSPDAFTVVELWFPAAQFEGVEEIPSAAAGSPGRRVLIVDDDDSFAEMLSTGLERLGYATARMSCPKGALAMFEKAPAHWDAVVTDQNMPEMTGLELVERIKRIRPVAPCIVCSGNAVDLDEAVVRAAGADAYLRKPVDPATLRRVIDGLLEIRRSSAA